MTDDEELAKKILDAIPEPAPEPPPPIWKWFWLYTMPPRERVDELHLLPIGTVTKALIGTPAFPVPDGTWPQCWKKRPVILPKDMAHWWLFNVGGGNVIEIVSRAAGNNIVFCDDCRAHATAHPQEIAKP